jgi:Cupin-like domain
MTSIQRRTPEYSNVTDVIFNDEIAPQNRPAILRQVVASWPAVQASQQSAEQLVAYLKQFDRGVPIETLNAEPAAGGRLFYSDDLRGFNFRRQKESLSAFLDRLLAQREVTDAPAMYVQSAPIPVHLPNWDQENPNPLLPAEIYPRIWIGNAVTATTHSDLASNIACLVAGRRRFTLFPPDQLPNLYIGPLEFSPAGRPISMVDLDNPNLEQHPRFAEALGCAEIAELEPGDAIYIPYQWWHHVRSLAPVNVLINYWWNEGAAIEESVSPYEALMLSLLTIRDLTPSQREVWRTIFDHYVFLQNGDPAAHLPEERRGVLGKIAPQHRAHIKAVLARLLAQK